MSPVLGRAAVAPCRAGQECRPAVLRLQQLPALQDALTGRGPRGRCGQWGRV